MTYRDEVERQLATWSAETYAPPSPRNLAAVVERTRDMRQRPAWASLERWLPMAVITRPATAPPPRVAWLMLVVSLAVALALGAAIIGASLLRSDASVELPPPFGPAGNGLIAHDGGGDIWVVQPDGTEPRRLTSGLELDYLPSWSPDGTKLAFWSVAHPDRTSTSVNDADFINSGTAALVVIDAAGGRRTEIASGLKIDWDFGTSASWAPDSRQLAYNHLEDGNPVIEIVSLDDRTPMTLVVGWSPSWSPQGTLIAYRGRAGVMVVQPDGTRVRQVTKASGSGYAFTYPQWSVDEKLITFYAGPDGMHDVWVASADGSAEWVIGEEVVEEYWPSFSPDGRRVAFGRNVGPGCCEFNFVVSGPRGSADQMTLEAGPFGPGTPNNWSPDGRFLLGERGTEDGQVVLELVDATGESATPSTEIVIAADWAYTSWQRVAPTEPIVGEVASFVGTWVVDRIDDVPVPEDFRAVVTFGDDGRLTGNGGCNVLNGRYSVNTDVPRRPSEDGSMTVSDLAPGGHTCSEAAIVFEATFLEGLRNADRFRMGDMSLTILPPFGSDDHWLELRPLGPDESRPPVWPGS